MHISCIVYYCRADTVQTRGVSSNLLVPLSQTQLPPEDDCIVNTSDPYSLDLDNFVNTLRTVIPEPNEFLPGFRTPCWYMHITLTAKIYQYLRNKALSDSKAAKLMSYIFGVERERDIESMETLVCIPNVFFIGFPRSGSTQLYKMMTTHPLLAGGMHKEPHWWTRFPHRAKFPHNMLAIIRYFAHFQEGSLRVQQSPNTLMIDGSQSTIWDTRSTGNVCIMPALISSIVPEAKYIVLMRDPVSRLFSDFKYLCEEQWDARHGEVPLAVVKNMTNVFDEQARLEISKFKRCLEVNSMEMCTHNAISGTHSKAMCSRVRLGISLYTVHISTWLRHLSIDRFLFLNTDDLSEQPYRTLSEIWDFLGVHKQTERELEDVFYQRANAGHASSLQLLKMKPETERLLREFFRPYNRELADLMDNDKFLWTDSSV